MGQQVFLDTNILLSFFEISQQEVETLSDAVLLADHQELIFVSTPQVKREFHKRRNGVLHKSIKDFSELRMPQPPMAVKSFSGIEEYYKARKDLTNVHQKLLEKMRSASVEHDFTADRVIENYFDKCNFINENKEILEAAHMRTLLGFPPGKNGSVGDRLNWECLLSLPEYINLTIVSDDVDFRDKLNNKKVDDFLERQWAENNDGELKLFTNLTDFLNSEFSDIHLPSLLEVDFLITKLGFSSSFSSTHACIEKLAAVTSFTSRQVNELVDVLNFNPKVFSLVESADVSDFYRMIYDGYFEKLTRDSRRSLFKKMNLRTESAVEPEGDLPF